MTHVASFWMRFNSAEEAEKAGKKYGSCPKVHFWGNKDDEAHIILKVPEDNKFWSDYVGENPENTFGGTEARIEYIGAVQSPEPIISYDKIEGERAPCGARCNTCPAYGMCSGCPALSLDNP
jgi:hypothetical protein